MITLTGVCSFSPLYEMNIKHPTDSIPKGLQYRSGSSWEESTWFNVIQERESPCHKR